MIASATASWLHDVLSPAEMIEWGWRVPFLAGGVLTLIGWFVRRSLEETPDFKSLQSAENVAEAPIMTLLRDHWRVTLALLCVIAVAHAGFYIILTYMAIYLEVERGFSAAQAGTITTIALMAYIPLVYLFATASDRFGRRTMLLTGSILFILVCYPAFVVLSSGGLYSALCIVLLLVTIYTLYESTWSTFFVESFPANIRVSGFSLPLNLGAVVFGGSAPLLAEWLIQITGNPLMPAFILIGVAVLSLPALFMMRETAPYVVGSTAFNIAPPRDH